MEKGRGNDLARERVLRLIKDGRFVSTRGQELRNSLQLRGIFMQCSLDNRIYFAYQEIIL